MKINMIELLLMLLLIEVCLGMNPCRDYVFIYMENGLRSSDFDSTDSEVSICDAYINPATWYRFQHDAGNRLIERPVEPWRCGTMAPIWLNGTHPTDRSEVSVGVCSTYSSENICGWNGTVRIRLCNESGSEYFVYLLAEPPGCPLAYCVDAASRKQCIPPLVWLEDQFKCGEVITGSSTVPLTTMATASSTFTERQSLAPTLSPSTEPPGSGWGTWGSWSVCSKLCDYGFQLRRRTCRQVPCEGPGNTYRLCNMYNCQSLAIEKTRGIWLSFQGSASQEDTVLKVVLNQQRIHDIIRKNINDICSQNVSMCCGRKYNGMSPLYKEFVLSGDIYTSQGSFKPRTDNILHCSYQAIAIINEDIDREICKGNSRRIYAKQAESSQHFLSSDVMMMASLKSACNILKETDLYVRADLDPATVTEDNDADGEVHCPSLAYVLTIGLCVSLVIVVVAILFCGFCLAKRSVKPKSVASCPKPVDLCPERPSFYEVLYTDSSKTMQDLPYDDAC